MNMARVYFQESGWPLLLLLLLWREDLLVLTRSYRPDMLPVDGRMERKGKGCRCRCRRCDAMRCCRPR